MAQGRLDRYVIMMLVVEAHLICGNATLGTGLADNEVWVLGRLCKVPGACPFRVSRCKYHRLAKHGQ
jgi:hypothetical protein